MKRIIAVLATLLFVVPLRAQDYNDYVNRIKEEMKRYTDSVKQDYDAFRRKANEEYAQFMRARWEEFDAMKGVPRPELPEPPQPFEFDRNNPIPDLLTPIPYTPIPVPEPSPIQPRRSDVPQPSPIPLAPQFEFTCYGTPCAVSLDNGLRFKLKEVSENAVADAWLHLSSEKSDVLLNDCLELREELALGDWAYYCLLRDLADAFLGENTDEAVLMCVYLLAQSGYKVRIGQKNGHLIPLLTFDGIVYEQVFITIQNEKYYDIRSNVDGSIHMYNRKFTDEERVMSLRMARPPKFAFNSTNNRTFTAKRYPELTVTLSVNKNLMDFYENYPSCMWTNYSWAGLSDELKTKLYPMLRKGIEGKSQIEAANRIINFVQTAFEYKTDQEYFGYERMLFGDEAFFYPYCDCEDRSVLFSTLIHDLLGLDVVLLLYPGHLATAVHYTEPLSGSYFEFEGKTYYISDPTYIGANVGMCAPKYINLSPEVYKL